jgi:hypothetical protein
MPRHTRFSLRLLFVIATFIAVAFGLLVRWSRLNQIAVRTLKESGAMLRGDYTSDETPWLLRTAFSDYKEYNARHVSFSRTTTVSDADIRILTPHLMTFRNLTLLSFSHQPTMTGRTLARFAKSRAGQAVVQLNLNNTGFSDIGVSHLPNLPSLSVLKINGAPISDECIDDLAKIQTLKTLELVDTSISKNGLAKLRKLLPNCRVNHRADSMQAMSIFHIQRHGGEITTNEEGFYAIHLHKQQSPITYATFGAIRGIPRLQHLSARNSHINDTWLELLDSFRHLRILDLSGSTTITDSAIPFLHKLSDLERIDVSRTAMTIGGIQQLRALMPNCLIKY